MIGSQIAGLRALKAEVQRLKAENQQLKNELSSVKASITLAMMSAWELKRLADGAKMHIWDGWNLILGAKKEARDRKDLVAQAESHIKDNPGDFVWIVLDGKDEKVFASGRIRVSYTGGEGKQRADRFICDYVRMAAYLGLAGKITVRSNDKDLVSSVKLFGKCFRRGAVDSFPSARGRLNNC